MKKMIVWLAVALLPVSGFAAGVVSSSPELLAKGKASYATNCATCHGDAGDGMGPAGQYMNPKPRNFAKDKFKKGTKPQQVFTSISQGLPNTSMTGYGHLSEDERWGLAYYVLSFMKK